MSQAYISDIPTTSTADQEVLVKVEGVSKKFCRSLKKSLWYGVCDIGAELNPFRRRAAEVAGNELRVTSPSGSASGGSISPATMLPKGHLAEPRFPPHATPRGLRPDEFYAVRDVSFELRRGECLGLIGHNGAGKTTLLRMLNGLIKPDHGRVEMNGRVGALIALGAGFNPILTGRENIYINGSVLGLSKKEIDDKIDEIIDFAEIWEFIDSPVQNYSSGMSVRLGYSVAANLNPDVLIVDEVLAVGDVAFQRKCMDGMTRYADSGGSLILVAHQMHAIQSVCDRCIVFEHGRLVFSGSTKEAVGIYHELQFSKAVHADESAFQHKEPNIGEPVVIRKVEVNGTTSPQPCTGETMRIKISYKALDAITEADWGFSIWSSDFRTRICTATASWDGCRTLLSQGEGILEASLPSLPLIANQYALRVGIYDSRHSWPIARLGWDEAPLLFNVVSPPAEKFNRQATSNDIIMISASWM
jgi:lipopolysaccharide transport system ATP-binding protein